MKIAQINLQHAKVATDDIIQYVVRSGIDLVLIQEPHVYKNKIIGLNLQDYDLISDQNNNIKPRTCILVNRKWGATPIIWGCNTDCTAALIEIRT